MQYPYRGGKDGFISLRHGDQTAAAFVELGYTGTEDNGFGLSALLLTESRIGASFNHMSYGLDTNTDKYSASSFYANYLFARDKHWAFNIGFGGRHEHQPLSKTNFSGLYRVDWFPVSPLRFSGAYEFDGESHLRLAGTYLYKRLGVGVALRSEKINGERFQQPEIFASFQF